MTTLIGMWLQLLIENSPLAWFLLWVIITGSVSGFVLLYVFFLNKLRELKGALQYLILFFLFGFSLIMGLLINIGIIWIRTKSFSDYTIYNPSITWVWIAIINGLFLIILFVYFYRDIKGVKDLLMQVIEFFAMAFLAIIIFTTLIPDLFSSNIIHLCSSFICTIFGKVLYDLFVILSIIVLGMVIKWVNKDFIKKRRYRKNKD